MTDQRPPVSDWHTDWDHMSPEWSRDPYPIWERLRRECPVASTERFQGAYLPTRYDDVKSIAYDTTHFSSRRVVVPAAMEGIPRIRALLTEIRSMRAAFDAMTGGGGPRKG